LPSPPTRRSLRSLTSFCPENRFRVQHCQSREHRPDHALPSSARSPRTEPLATRLLTTPHVDEERELCLPGEFAEAVAVSTTAFCQLAKTHDQFIREETVARLNEKGFAKTFQIGDKVKVRVPPTAAQMEETGRRAKHITAWRGPCTIIERLSQTAYVAVDDSSKRRYERVISNLLPYRAKKAKTNADANFNPQYSDPFTEDEFIAIRDEHTGPFFPARVLMVTDECLSVHYYGRNFTGGRDFQALLA
jgi:hypothetical protein